MKTKIKHCALCEEIIPPSKGRGKSNKKYCGSPKEPGTCAYKAIHERYISSRWINQNAKMHRERRYSPVEVGWLNG